MGVQKTSSKKGLREITVPEWLSRLSLIECKSLPDVQEMVTDLLSSENPIMYDIETTGLRTYDDIVVSMQFANRSDKAYFIPIAMNNGMTNLPIAEVAKLCQPLFDRGMVGHNIKFDWKMSRRHFDFKILADTMLDCRMYDSEMMAGLKNVSQKLLRVSETLELKQFFKRGEPVRFDLMTPEFAVAYACQDVILTNRLYHLFSSSERVDRTSFIYNLELELIKVVGDMELTGVGLSMDVIREGLEKSEKLIAKLQTDIDILAGRPVALSKTNDLKKLLYEELGLPILKQTEKGEPSTDAATLDMLKGKSPVVDLILDYRKVAKLREAFLEPIPQMVQGDGCIHASFNQFGTRTGRFSSSEPNLQQIPKNRAEGDNQTEIDELTSYLRAAIVPPKGFIGFVDADYAQIEYVLFASLSQEPSLLEAFATGVDVHKKTAAIVFGVPVDKVTKEQRQAGKTLNFSILYGASHYRIAEQLGITDVEAQNILADYWRKLPTIQHFVEGIHTDTRRRGYASTFFGRRRYLPNIMSHDRRERMSAQREAVSTAVQGSAADLVKMALVRVHNLFTDAGLKSKLCLTVHDQIVVAHHPDDDKKKVAELLCEGMEIQIEGWAAVKAEVGYGINWRDIKDLTDPVAVPHQVTKSVSNTLQLPETQPFMIINANVMSPILKSILDKYAGDDYVYLDSHENPVSTHKVRLCRELFIALKHAEYDYTLNKLAQIKLWS